MKDGMKDERLRVPQKQWSSSHEAFFGLLDHFTNQAPIILPSSPSLSHSVLVTSYLSVQWFVLHPFAYKSSVPAAS